MFYYDSNPHQRRHGPFGYTNYRAYKPWLRDDFYFQCIYCRCKEVWDSMGHHVYSVDHLRPKSQYPQDALNYENLLYSCVRCNTLKGDAHIAVDPCKVGLGEYLILSDSGLIRPRNRDGTIIIEVLRLNRPELLSFRKHLMQLAKDPSAAVQNFLTALPVDLPDLQSPPAPKGNSKPNGVQESFCERRKRGDL